MAAVYLETDAAVEIGFTAWISPYATIMGVAVTCGEVRTVLIFAKPSMSVADSF